MKGFGIQHLTVPAGDCINNSSIEYIKIKLFYDKAVDSTIKICKVYEANYPEVLRKLFIINSILNFHN